MDGAGASGNKKRSSRRRLSKCKNKQHHDAVHVLATNTKKEQTSTSTFQLRCDDNNEVVMLKCGGSALLEMEIMELEEEAKHHRDQIEEEEVRMVFLRNYVTKSMKVKHEKWMRMMQADEYIKYVYDFLERDSNSLFITTNYNGLLMVVPSLEQLRNQSGKISYFVKKLPGPLKHCHDLICGDLSQGLIDTLAVLSEEVYFPLIKTQIDCKTWPNIIQENVHKQLNEFQSALYQVKGSLDGVTLLPFPHELTSSSLEESKQRLLKEDVLESDLALKASLDSCLVKWSILIANIIKQTPLSLVSEGQYPGPLHELEFWGKRAINLKNIYKQLKMQDARDLLAYAESARSSSLLHFHQRTFKNLISEIVEAQNIHLYMSALKEQFLKFEEMTLFDLLPHVGPMFHCIGLLWKECESYRKNERVLFLLQEVGHAFIQVIVRTVNPSGLFVGDADETVSKITQSIDAIALFIRSYDYVKTGLSRSVLSGITWTYPSASLYQRVYHFRGRLLLIKEILDSYLAFTKLEKIELGGSRGRSLTMNIVEIHDEFLTCYQTLQNVQYNVLDLDDDTIQRDFNIFMEACHHFYSRLATICGHAFEDCPNLEACYKFVHVLSDFCEHKDILQQLAPKYMNVVQMLETELIMIKEQYVQKWNVASHLPPVYGKLTWLVQLRRRTELHVNYFEELHNKLRRNQSSHDLFEKGQRLIAQFRDEELSTVHEWIAQIPEVICNRISKTLLSRNEENQLLTFNMDDLFLEMLMELKYIAVMGYQDVLPFEANAVYQRSEEFSETVQILGEVVHFYNYLLTKLQPEDMRIISEQVQDIDGHLFACFDTFTWEHNHIAETKLIHGKVRNLYDRVVMAQKNLSFLNKSIAALNNNSLFARNDTESKELLSLLNRDKEIDSRNKAIDAVANEFHQTIKANYYLLYNVANVPTFQELRTNSIQSSDAIYSCQGLKDPKWLSYLSRIHTMTMNTLLEGTRLNLSFFIYEMTITYSANPLFRVAVELRDQNITTTPPMNELEEGNFVQCIHDILAEIFDTAKRYPCILPEDINQIKGDPEVHAMMQTIIIKSQEIVDEALQFLNGFECYSCLWTCNKDDWIKHFLKYGEAITIEHWPSINAETNEVTPTLDQFKTQILYFEELYDRIDKTICNEHKIKNCLLLDLRQFRQSLLNVTLKWSNLFKQHLVDCVINGISELEAFIARCLELIAKPTIDNDLDALIQIMGCLSKIKERQLITDNMFLPLRRIIDLLTYYDVDFPEDVCVKLQALPSQWETCKKIAALTKQIMAPLQASQINAIRKRLSLFDVQQSIHREDFKKLPIFQYGCQHIYMKLDRCNEELCELEIAMDKLKEQGQLFELQMSEFKHVTSTRRDLKLLKGVWDYVGMCNSWIDEWKYTPWKRIDVEAMDMDCKRFGKDLRAMDKDVRSWDVYIQMEANLKNMLTSLRAVTELQNPSIRERHWNQLMRIIKTPGVNEYSTTVKIVMDPSTTLNDLLSLRLHDYEDEVRNIVDRSIKEVTMEKTITDLCETWSERSFDFEIHDRTRIHIILVSEELIETLEDHQVQLQNMLTSKFIEFFYDEITDWQKKLSNVDQVISVFLEVQRKWGYLESIFIGSEDIRSQLANDSDRFDRIDEKFRGILTHIKSNGNVLASTNATDFYDVLEQILNDLVQCEKALNDYLERKRLSFPRFYFLSSADLLDILSNGNHPDLIQRHLTKLFDSLAKLNFESPSKKTAMGMLSKENDEFVPFHVGCECSGKVEIWLSRLIETMREALRLLFAEAVDAYDEQPREIWIYEYPAQVALVCIQIWWSTETHYAFAKLEEGYENALKDYNKKQVNQLNTLIVQLQGELSTGNRQKVMTICTIDVHSRDVISQLIAMKVENAQAFQWQTQLRHRWDLSVKDCYGNICDAQIRYQYEYLGNTPRLVITPLTDRCYITLTQSLHLVMGGAPAGPAGTGKTETTKDLGKALGIMVYVFNCSEQMDYKSVGNIYKGLVQTGTWGCFDEFNRISVEVLSVVAVQVKTIQDAIKHHSTTFRFLQEEIKLINTVGIFITMNPGYAGRTELPENLKALFRPCAMVVPDFELICEIMLVAEGFQDARVLARKFITLYTLCRELLSKQDHYDWGLRAIKSVLVVAGALKRGDRQRPEDQVLMRALRDFNIPKIITDDVPIFMGLISDLFPALEVPRKRDADFEKMVKKSSIDLRLQPEDGFVLKVVQLEELFDVRHSVFIIGFAGTGKSMVWRTLFKTYANQKRRPVYNDLNPKAVTNDELFGVINPSTREWRDGLFSAIIREQANLPGDAPRWIVLDGDIDPMWIESLNTLMDDNKVLTLASNERISLTAQMRLLFEIANLRSATPATVSRAGILYINPKDLGWNPYVTSWIETRSTNTTEKALLSAMFDKYVPPCLEVLSTKFKLMTPMVDVTHLSMLCHLLDCFLTADHVPPDCPREWYEIYFVFCTVWAFGAALFQDHIIDWRLEFSKWFMHEFKVIKFPQGAEAGTVFDYYIDEKSKGFLPWGDIIEPFYLNTDIPLQATIVDTAETRRIRFLLDHLMSKRVPCMLVGPSGCGKSVLVAEKLCSLPDQYQVTNVPFNFYTTSEMLQKILERPLEKKAGRVYGPPGNKLMVYFIDDLNMPEVDKYFTVQPHTLLRQHIDYQHWYDRHKLSLKEIHNVQYVACMNPTAGSFYIDPRLQRHFCVMSLHFPSSESLQTIYMTILSQHLQCGFNQLVCKLCPTIVTAALTLHQKVAANFLPTAVKFHYVFNLRDLSNVFQGLLFSTADGLNTVTDFIRLWMHESFRVYGDKMVCTKDLDAFHKLANEITKKTFEELDESNVMARPLIFCHFADGIGDPKYLQINRYEDLHKLLLEAQTSYNDLVAAMNLILFEDAMNHICRINRILEAPRGNLLLVGVGGTGKQSLTRLAAFIASLDIFQIQLKKGYSINDLKLDIATMYLKAAMKNVATAFLMTDSQVDDEQFLVLVNYMLASGEIPDLLTDDEIEEVVNLLKSEVKAAGLEDTKEVCWKFYVDKVRRLIKVVLCFSPVGSTLRIRARKFPALINCTAINWFHDWPKEALINVSRRFLAEIECLPNQYVPSAAEFMSFVHMIVNKVSQAYFQFEKRYNYTTPKTFLEQIALYAKLLNEKTSLLKQNVQRLENGLLKLESTSHEVDDLQVVLAVQEVELSKKNEAADKLIRILSAENEKVGREQALASEEEAKVKVIEEDVGVKAQICEEDLRMAEPALGAAMEALNTLNKGNLTELKSFGSPPDAVVNVCAAVLVLFAKKGKIPKDRSWKACKLLMGKVDQFLNDLLCYDKENIHPDVVRAVLPYINDTEFEPQKILTKSIAAAGLCAWVINIVKYYDIFLIVEPKRKALQKAVAELKHARQTLKDLKEKLQQLERQLSVLRAEYEEATDAKLKCKVEADATTAMINLAKRLINGLGSENLRWRESVERLRGSNYKLPGDILLVTAFVSYVGCFTRKYREELVIKHWIPYLVSLDPPIQTTPGLDPLTLLTDDTLIANWTNEGLPTDRMSSENATILSNTARWPLMIDPQLQGIKWIKNRYGSSELTVIRLSTKNYLETIERCLTLGSIVLLENIGESIDGVLDPILGRILVKRGKLIRIGDKEVDYNPQFKLIIQTKLANPHYKPEIQAQTTLINFTVTRSGLEEQLLAEVVKSECPDLEISKSLLTKQQNDFKITLKNCEDNLLERLSSATGNILEDVTLVLSLETTKRTAADISIKAAEARVTSFKIDEAREQYRPASARASLLYFILNDLNHINAIYQFSLKAFTAVFKKSLIVAQPAKDVSQRVDNLLDSITYGVCMYTSRGLFERDKLIFLAQMTLQILICNKEIAPVELDFLLRFPVATNITSPFDFLSNILWGAVKALSQMDDFKGLDKDIEGSVKRWRKFVDSEYPESEKLPGEWKNRSALQRLCIMRCLRPDRMTYAMRAFIQAKLGAKFILPRTITFEESYEETSNSTPILFILSPGVNPLQDVTTLGAKLGFTVEMRNLHNVALGQGQEAIAECAMDQSARLGHWVILQNVHLVERWLPRLEKKMDLLDAHPNYRLFLSAEPSNALPVGIVESSIKITNEPPTGMFANLHKALDNFGQETCEMCTKEVEFRAILFSLCYFHAVVAERRKFGPQGWNRSYPFNVGDLTISVNVLHNYLENNNKVPWEDLRYLFGEIMYGGHITDDWDRRLCRNYLLEYMQPSLLEGELYYAPGFKAPTNTDYYGYHRYIDEQLPAESPYLYGLHPNAEIGFLTGQAESMFRTIFEMQSQNSSGGATPSGGVEGSRGDKVRSTLDDILEKLPETFNLKEMMARTEDRSPYIIVCFQECGRMNALLSVIRQSLKDLGLGLKGELTITPDMEQLEVELFLDQVPVKWANEAYPSLLPLGQWCADLVSRIKELESWTQDFAMPSAVWLGGLFNPQSFLTAIMQQMARRSELPLDKMTLHVEVTRKQRDDVLVAPTEGANIYGLFIEGARWDVTTGGISDAILKDLFPTLPVVRLKAITQDKEDLRCTYECPVYKTRSRGMTYVWTFNLRTLEKPSKWVLAGVAILLQI